eukprot:6062292-Prymnesium_polylepis.1
MSGLRRTRVCFSWHQNVVKKCCARDRYHLEHLECGLLPHVACQASQLGHVAAHVDLQRRRFGTRVARRGGADSSQRARSYAMVRRVLLDDESDDDEADAPAPPNVADEAGESAEAAGPADDDDDM